MSTARVTAVVAGATVVAAAAVAIFLGARGTPTVAGAGRLVSATADRRSPAARITPPAAIPSSVPAATAPRDTGGRLTLPPAFAAPAASNPKIGASVVIYNGLPAAGRATIARIGAFVAQHPDQAGLVCTQLDGVLGGTVIVQGLTGFDGSTIPPGTDIQALAFIVLMEATNDNDNDLDLIAAETKAQTNAKQFLRQQMTIVADDIAANVAGQQTSPNETPSPSPGGRAFLVPAPTQLVTRFQLPTVSGDRLTYVQVDLTIGGQPPVTSDQLQAVQVDLQGDLDAIDDSSDVTSMRLQMAGGAIATTWSLPSLLTEISGAT